MYESYTPPVPDRCQFCGHKWHGLPCRSGLFIFDCDCPSAWRDAEEDQ